ncbi:nitrite reductase/ring-hydroxylating ferredoxin subunit [Paraperlucidibaca baekdonensis]|uniref:Nitrite reductase/ring-hydroxylating ferredoxin subunit n=1 Tax=Paraperlucidibaca baekdonensis TaxID=748120 RepID=A0A3E0H423_9GAMM|nr:Rieske (2Fe-2S) protein [Paraperlucidibaca baekdonensis]REH36937.1 nitrite reductase/ring-hydroxylating ferredoxin subunit [Paraperlucidibaca baekdonensis]
MPYLALEKLMYLDEGYRGEFVVDGVPLLLIQEAGQRLLIRNQCPHRQADLRDARMQVVDGESTLSLRCSKHGWRFDAITGECKMPGPGACLTRYALVLEGATIGVMTPLQALPAHTASDSGSLREPHNLWSQ